MIIITRIKRAIPNKVIARLTLVFSLPFCLLLPDGNYQVKTDKDEIVTLNLTKVIPKIFDERLPYRGFLKGESENIVTLKIWDEKRGPGGWVSIDQLKDISAKKFVIEYKTRDGKNVVAQDDPTIIAKDVNIGQDININPEKLTQSFKPENISPESIKQIISETAGYGRQLIINAEVKNDPVGRFRYTKVRYTSKKLEQDLEEQFKEAVRVVNILIARYRSITGDYWITKVREEDIFTYKGIQDGSLDFTALAKGFVEVRPDHNRDIVDNLRESLVSDIPELPYIHLFRDAENAFERADNYLAVILSIVAVESIIKTYLIFYSIKCPPIIQDEVNRINLTRLVTNVLKNIFPADDYKNVMKNVIHAIELRNNIIHQSEIDISKDLAQTVIKDVAEYIEFVENSRI